MLDSPVKIERMPNIGSIERSDMIAEDEKLSLLQRRIVSREILDHIRAGDLWETYTIETIDSCRDKYFSITGETCLPIPTLHANSVLLSEYTNDLQLERLDGRRTITTVRFRTLLGYEQKKTTGSMLSEH